MTNVLQITTDFLAIHYNDATGHIKSQQER